MPLPNRLALYITGAASLLAALAPVVADLDWTSTAGIAAGLASFAAVMYKWLDNWGKWERDEEERNARELSPMVDPIDDFDEDEAPPIPPETADAANAEIPPERDTPNVPTPAKGTTLRKSDG